LRYRLDIVGTGLSIGLHLTAEGRYLIEQADEVHYVMPDSVAAKFVESINPNAAPLTDLYEQFDQRGDVYRAMVDRVLERLQAGKRVCVALYGHPAVFVDASHEMVARARAAGIPAAMHPGISAADCLYADLGVDPGTVGCQHFSADDYLTSERQPDPRSAVVLWQIGAVGDQSTAAVYSVERLEQLRDRLVGIYGREHDVTLYEASIGPLLGPKIMPLALGDLATADLSPRTTLYIPGLS
jgi:uncharacterized protein YabN with tetrapyrrole methylase and pyrophosphatase domain